MMILKRLSSQTLLTLLCRMIHTVCGLFSSLKNKSFDDGTLKYVKLYIHTVYNNIFERPIDLSL